MKILKIRLPRNEDDRIKKVISRSNTRPTGKYPSWKMGRMMHWNRIEQLNAFRLLDANPDVLCFEEFPIEIEYEVNGKTYLEHPDILVEIAGKKELWKIENSSQIDTPFSILSQHEFKEQLLPSGFYWRIINPHTLTLEPRKENVITLLRHGKAAVNPIERESIRRHMENSEYISWGEVLGGCIGPAGRKNICRLAIEGQVYFDINQTWTNKTLFHWKNIQDELVEKGGL
jgi:hypothetical protein